MDRRGEPHLLQLMVGPLPEPQLFPSLELEDVEVEYDSLSRAGGPFERPELEVFPPKE